MDERKAKDGGSFILAECVRPTQRTHFKHEEERMSHTPSSQLTVQQLQYQQFAKKIQVVQEQPTEEKKQPCPLK